MQWRWDGRVVGGGREVQPFHQFADRLLLPLPCSCFLRLHKVLVRQRLPPSQRRVAGLYAEPPDVGGAVVATRAGRQIPVCLR